MVQKKEEKNKWRREMDLLLSPTNYMVELVPAKQDGANGQTLEIMTAIARGADIQMNLPALKKLEYVLIETLDKVVNTEFWYAEGSRAEGKEILDEKHYNVLAEQSYSAEDMLHSLNLASELSVLEAVNRLEAAVLAWR